MTEQPSRRAKRVDEAGRAIAGSQLQLQLYVHCRRAEIDSAIQNALHLDAAPLDWRSPLESSRYKEFRDAAFLRIMGLTHLEEQLRRFWPASGPRWDGLAYGRVETRPAVVLIEAKNYPREVRGNGCQAVEASESRKQISAALEASGRALGVNETSHWMGSLYQYANRLAHVAFLREHGVSTFLVNVCFYEDPKKRRFTTLRTWEDAARDLKGEVGFDEVPFWLADVFLKARSRDEFVPPTI